MMHKLPVAVFILFLPFISTDARSNIITKLSLDEQVIKSDVVATGHVLSFGHQVNREYEYSIIHLDVVLKGKTSSAIKFITSGEIAEDDPNCCLIGHEYLLFMTRGRGVYDGVYGTVNGHYGVYDLGAEIAH